MGRHAQGRKLRDSRYDSQSSDLIRGEIRLSPNSSSDLINDLPPVLLLRAATMQLPKPHTRLSKLVLAFDIGTTYSSVSYCILQPPQVPEVLTVEGQGPYLFPLVFINSS